MRKHFLRAGALVVSLAALLGWLAYTRFDFFVPRLASEEGVVVDRLLRVHFFLIAAIFALVVGFAVYSMWAFRRRADDDTPGAAIHGHGGLEFLWTVIPLGIVLSLSAMGVRDFLFLRRTDADLTVQVQAQQFSWGFVYPEYDIRSPELVVPTGQRVKFELTSLDVIHSFWVVEFRIKEDAVPGMTTYAYVTPRTEGEYRVRCAELCGSGHANMYAPVRVVSPEAFDAWVAEQQAAQQQAASPVARGEQIFQQYCAACHTLDGSPKVGPSLNGLAGRTTTLDDGTTVTVDEAYIRESILDPQAKIVAGYPPVMPATFGQALSEDDLDALVQFLLQAGE